MARLNVPIPDDVHLRFKVQCTMARLTMADVVVQLVEQWTGKQETGKGKGKKKG